MQQKRAPQPASAYFLEKFGNQIRLFGYQFKKNMYLCGETIK